MTAHADFAKWCQRKYADKTTTTNYECKTDVSPVKYLFASEFDVVKAQNVVTELKKKNVLEAYKKFGRCFDFPVAPFGSPNQTLYEGDPALSKCLHACPSLSHNNPTQGRVIQIMRSW